MAGCPLSAEKFFAYLKDEAWHSIAEMSEKTQIEADKLVEYSKFLASKGIVKYEDRDQKSDRT